MSLTLYLILLTESQSFTVQDDHQEGELMSLQSTLEQVAMKNNRFDEVLKEVIDNHSCPAELFQIIFHSFEAGIANTISSFN